MVMRNLVLGGVTVVGLALTGTGAWAQYERQSTPAERAQTQQLNRDGVKVVRPTPQEQADYDAARARYEQSQERYRQQLDEYNARTQQYSAEQQRYGDDRDTYAGREDTYQDRNDDYRDDAYADGDAATDASNYPYPDDDVSDADVAAADAAEGGELWSLDRFSNPDDELYNMPVVDIDGFSVGHFRRIETRDDGQRMVVITLNSMRTVSLPMEDIRYDPDMSVVVAVLTLREIDATPSGPFAG